MKALYKFHFDCGRGGMLNGLFIAEEKEIEKLIKSREEVTYGEVNGKHSWVKGPLDECDFTRVTNDINVLNLVNQFDLTHGINPIETYKERCYEQNKKSIFDE